MGYLCANDDGNGAALLVSNLDNGETYAVCAACIPGWAKALVEAFPETEAPPIQDECPVCGAMIALSEADQHWATEHGNLAPMPAPGPDDDPDDEPKPAPDPTDPDAMPSTGPAGPAPGGQSGPGSSGGDDPANERTSSTAYLPGDSPTVVDKPGDGQGGRGPSPVTEDVPA